MWNVPPGIRIIPGDDAAGAVVVLQAPTIAAFTVKTMRASSWRRNPRFNTIFRGLAALPFGARFRINGGLS
jgi:hypothetical protein